MNRLRAKGRRFDVRPAGFFCDAIRKGDPTGTLDIRRSYGSKGEQRWRKVLGILVQQLGQSRDILGLDPAHLSVLASDNRVRALQSWLSDLIGRVVIEGSGEWLRPMVAISYARAVARGMRLTKKPIQPSDQQSTIGALWALSVAELQGIGEAAVQQIVREASLAILHHDRPTNLVRAVQGRIKAIGITRTRAMVELMVVKAFSTGTLDQFAAAGIKQVGLIPETIPRPRVGDARITDAPLRSGPGALINRLTGATSQRTIQRIRKVARGLESFALVNVETAGDEDVCPICQDIEDDNPYSINEARSLIPAHPRCRCAFMPLEDDYQDTQPRS